MITYFHSSPSISFDGMFENVQGLLLILCLGITSGRACGSCGILRIETGSAVWNASALTALYCLSAPAPNFYHSVLYLVLISSMLKPSSWLICYPITDMFIGNMEVLKHIFYNMILHTIELERCKRLLLQHLCIYA